MKVPNFRLLATLALLFRGPLTLKWVLLIPAPDIPELVGYLIKQSKPKPVIDHRLHFLQMQGKKRAFPLLYKAVSLISNHLQNGTWKAYVLVSMNTMKSISRHLNRRLPSVDRLLTLNLIVWGIAALLMVGGAICFR